MTTTLRSCYGRPILSRETAVHLGTLEHYVLDVGRGSISALATTSGKQTLILDWANISSFGPDAIVIGSDADLRPANGERENQTLSGALALIGKSVLSDQGCALGVLDDASFEEASGLLTTLHIDGHDIPIAALRGHGSYAVMVSHAAMS
jgi:uncharacterized protein YrrD